MLIRSFRESCEMRLSYGPFIVAGIILVFVQVVEPGLVRWYGQHDLDGLFYEVKPKEGCNNLPKIYRGKAASIETDTCLIIFSELNCSEEAYSYKVPAGSHPDTSHFKNSQFDFHGEIESFMECNETFGGNEVNVDLLYSTEQSMLPLLHYNDVCECINMPNFTSKLITSVENHGNCIKLYSDRGCTGQEVLIPGGVSPESLDLKEVNFSRKTKAIGPCFENPSCLKLNATIFKLRVYTEQRAVESMGSTDEVEMRPKATLKNHGGATVITDYVAKKQIVERMVVKRAHELRSIKRLGVAEVLVVDSQITNFPFFSKSRISALFKEMYGGGGDLGGGGSGEEFVKEDIREFSVNQRITLPPCTSYTVTSHVRMYHNYPVEYEIFLRVGGTLGRRRMTKEEVRERVKELEWVRDHDDFTIIAKAQGTITSEFGLDSVVDSMGKHLKECGKDRNPFHFNGPVDRRAGGYGGYPNSNAYHPQWSPRQQQYKY